MSIWYHISSLTIWYACNVIIAMYGTMIHQDHIWYHIASQHISTISCAHIWYHDSSTMLDISAFSGPYLECLCWFQQLISSLCHARSMQSLAYTVASCYAAQYALLCSCHVTQHSSWSDCSTYRHVDVGGRTIEARIFWRHHAQTQAEARAGNNHTRWWNAEANEHITSVMLVVARAHCRL